MPMRNKGKLSASQAPSSQAAGGNKYCKECALVIADQECLTCDICSTDYHNNCVGINDAIYGKFVDIRPVVGWACPTCSKLLWERSKKMQSSHTQLADDVCALKVAVEQLQAGSSAQLTPMFVSVLKTTPAKTEFRKEIRAVIKDADKRSHNVVISGLDSAMGQDDIITAQQLFESNLTLKPYTVQCKRIWIPVMNHPQKLLVTLRSTDDVTSVLSAAKQLRQSADSVVRDLVYINKDMSPEDSKAAFEYCVKRQTEGSTNTLISAAVTTSSVPISTHSLLRADAVSFSLSSVAAKLFNFYQLILIFNTCFSSEYD